MCEDVCGEVCETCAGTCVAKCVGMCVLRCVGKCVAKRVVKWTVDLDSKHHASVGTHGSTRDAEYLLTPMPIRWIWCRAHINLVRRIATWSCPH